MLMNERSEETRADGEIQFPQLPVVLNMNAEPEVASLKNRLLARRPRLGWTGEVVVFVCYLVWQCEGQVQFTEKNVHCFPVKVSLRHWQIICIYLIF